MPRISTFHGIVVQTRPSAGVGVGRPAPAGGRRIELPLADGTTRVVDVADRLTGTVCWPGDVDLAPERLLSLPAV